MKETPPRAAAAPKPASAPVQAAPVPAAAGAALVPAGVAGDAVARVLAGGGRKAAAQEPAVRIEIGRVDVRAAPPVAAGPRARRAPALTLAQYLRQGGRR